MPINYKGNICEDEKFMARCIQLALNGRKNAQPNPMVGAVIVHDGKIIGEGYHRKCGEAHAEVNAINSVKDPDLLKDSTIYVSLEPCAHYGKTPPCADLIISKRLKRVVVGCTDPFAKVNGLGIRKIKEAGIDVTVGVLEKECKHLNRVFFTFHSQHRPFVVLKWAQSPDGFIAGKNQKTIISTSYTQMLAHKRRTECQAIIVGTNTANIDNPKLDARKWHGNNPVRVVIDKEKKLSHDLHLFDGSVTTIVFADNSSNDVNSKANANESSASLATKTNTAEPVKYIYIDFKQNIIPQILDHLYLLGIQSLLVEGGAQLLQSFIDYGVWDEAYVEIGGNNIIEGVEAPNMRKTNERNQSCQNSSEMPDSKAVLVNTDNCFGRLIYEYENILNKF